MDFFNENSEIINDFINLFIVNNCDNHDENNNSYNLNNILTDEKKKRLNVILLENDKLNILTIMSKIDTIYDRLQNISYPIFAKIIWHLFNWEFYDKIYVEMFNDGKYFYVKHFLYSAILVEFVKIKATKKGIKYLYGDTISNERLYENLWRIINDCQNTIRELYGFIKEDFIDDFIYVITTDLIKSNDETLL